MSPALKNASPRFCSVVISMGQLYEERIINFRELPPPVDWDGVYAALTK
jgi:hypothetical protein